MSTRKVYKSQDQMKEEWDAEWQRQLALLPENKRKIIAQDPEDSAADAVDKATERALVARYAAQGKDWGEV